MLITFSILSVFLARNMLSNSEIMPNLLSNNKIERLDNNEHSLAIKPWQEAPKHLVYFFAPWCTVCRFSQPSLAAFTKLKPDIQIVMVAMDWEDREAVMSFKQNHEFDHAILLGNEALKTLWKIDAYPSYYFVDSNGKILSKDRGLVTLPGLMARSYK